MIGVGVFSKSGYNPFFQTHSNREANVTRHTIVEIHKDEISFSAGHFTIFSATDRENLHGHNYNVSLALHTTLPENGLAFDYRFYKTKLLNIISQLDRCFLLPAHSEYLKLEEVDDMVFAHFNNERLPFLKKDIRILPISNTTIEEFSHWALQLLLEDKAQILEHHIHEITVKFYNGPGQSGSATWRK